MIDLDLLLHGTQPAAEYLGQGFQRIASRQTSVPIKFLAATSAIGVVYFGGRTLIQLNHVVHPHEPPLQQASTDIHPTLYQLAKNVLGVSGAALGFAASVHLSQITPLGRPR